MTGYLEEEEEQEEEVRLNTILEKRLKRKIESLKSKKKPKLAKQESFESNNWDDDDDDNEENNSSLEEDSDNDEDMEDEEDENDDDEEEEQEHEHEEFTKNLQQQSKKQKKKAEQQKNNLIEAKKRIIQGMQVEDTNFGNGALATNGKYVTIYYVGYCKIGKKEKKIDSCTQENGFKFLLGTGQVIQGLDVGISGMKVGGKRRLTIPSNMAFGSKGCLSTIPPYSTLVFDIELKKVN